MPNNTEPLRLHADDPTAGQGVEELPRTSTVAAVLPPPQSVVYTRPQLGALLQLSVRALERMEAAGRLPPGARLAGLGRAARFSRAIIDEWIRQGCPVPARPRRR
jgi:hypothetical protein